MVDRAAARAQAVSSDPPPPALLEPDPRLSQPGAADGQEVASAGATAGPPSLPQASDAEEDALASPAGQPGERCRAMMEVVAKDGAWKVTKLVVEHCHELQVAPGHVAVTVPALGMEFDSVDDAKGFYYGYGEQVGFKARMGSNRRSVGDGEKILQRFLCWKGNYANRSRCKDSDAGKETDEVLEGLSAAAGKRKREPYKTRSRNPGRSTEVIEVEKGVGLGGAGNGLELDNGRRSRRGRSKKAEVEHGEDSVVGFEAEEVAKAVSDADEEEDEGDEDQEAAEQEVEVEVKEQRARGRPRKAVMEDNALQARVLRELGVRALQYNNEERKKILNKYRSKRQSRSVSSRPTKISSRQALAERRKRGNGGRFLSSEEQPLPSERRSKRLKKQNLKMQKAESKEDETMEAEPDPEIDVVPGPGGEPKVGMVFLNEDKAYEFYANYAETAGFSVRKGWLDKTAKNVTKSRAYVCSKEGFRPRSASIESKKPSLEARTGCQAHMTIKITASTKYVVTEFVADHNHDLETPLVDIQILKSEKLLAKISKCVVYSCGEIGPISEYQVTVKDRPQGQFVRFDSTECMVVCSCKKFEFMGLLCCHVLKILDLRNIKELPRHYILKRWRKDAQSESPENYGFAAIDEDPKFSLSKRYNALYRNLYKIAAKASESVEAYAFLENQYEQLVEQVEVLLQAKLHDKSSLSTVLKGNQPNMLNSEVNSSEHRRATVLLEPEIEIPLRVEPPTVSNDIQNHLRTTNQFLAPSHMMQAPYVAQQFGLGSLQGFPGMSPFGQIQEPTPLQQPHLQPPSFHSGPQITQAPPPDIQSLQFLSSNPQLGHQTTDQGQYTIPVWDFL
ncbi:Protein FAR1-RELATED SEQUENCE 9 [Zea mays]|uniref:Protein FAR1-RELATED SEQUENCE 9 n=1 Tax=Zea mays TaxID=4577 RepID=A0A317YBT8_MAIZE|nr:Protein FAR1-RELATED SEQUENCE 9 [Zea mays]